MNAKNKKHLGKKLKKNVETELITDCQYQLELAQEKIMRLQLDVEKFNNSAYKAKKQVALLEENVKTFNSSAYNAKKEVNRLNSLTKEQNLYISNLEQRLLGLADDYNQIVIDYNDNILDLKKKTVTLSYWIGQAFIKLKTLNGILHFIPNILEAKRKHNEKLQYGSEKIKNISLIRSEELLAKRKNYINLLVGITPNNDSQPKVTAESLEKIAASIPDSNGIAYYKRIPLNIAIVTDEFMFNYYNGAFENLYYVNPDNYKLVFDNHKIDAFLYVSCWSGMLNDDWRGIKYREKSMKAFDEIIQICKNRGIKTIFQTIEDPSNYDNFLPIAQKFNYIFTSAIEKIADYQRDCNNPNVDYLEYGFNPMLNNPIGLYREVIDGVFFAGSYPQRYAERCNDMHTMFSSIQKSNGSLVIADRNSHLEDDKLKFPIEYKENVISAIQHKMLQKVHKVFRYNANFNSIKDSMTMCAMRVYELQAQGALILSNYALSISNRFPNIKIITQKEDLSPIFKGTKDIEVNELIARVNTLRGVLENKSVFDQAVKMLNKCGFEIPLTSPKVLVVKLDAQASLPDQTYQNYAVVYPKELVRTTQADYVCCISSGNQYSTHYLQDLLNGFKYVDVDFVTQSATIGENGKISGKVFDYTNENCIIDKSMVKISAFDISALQVESDNGFAIEPFGLDFFVNNNAIKQPELSIIIPVYNNGIFLRDRCLSSLKLDSNFNKFQIILIDDGSEKETLTIIDELACQYQNIIVYKYPRGGSGSASRARNKGVELAKSDYITYLDPDNEISLNGYSALLSIISEQVGKGTQADFVTGYQNKIMESGIVRNAYHTDKPVSYIDDTKYFTLHKNYPIISTQAFICKKSLVLDNDIKFVEQAVGQDTLFGHEIMVNAKGGLFSASAYINYYAERKSSVTNVVDKRFFEKSLILEEYQVKKFKELGIFEHYRDNKFPKFYKDWYLVKLNQIPDGSQMELKILLDRIVSLYK
ncbi:glycosyltransferase [Uruburuella suis]|jgi:glycosyltransferase involved in cell wall biosynthesis|uniref:glycosyltransferase n=1 Tax=Uruburuella suis TaxID=252130 RepID=UPI0024924BEE|nr:glycosyltransferase [Uruburuella suis]